MPGQPMGALSTVGPLEIEQRSYPLLDVTTESQLLQDATVSASFWGQQGYVAWGPRSPQAQKAVNKLLDGIPQQQANTDSQPQRPKRTKSRPLNVQDSHVILGPNGIDPNVRLGTPPYPPISSPINPGPRQPSPSGSPNLTASLRSGMSPSSRGHAAKGSGLISAAVDSAARSSAQHVSVGRHGRSPITGVKAKADRKHRGQPSAGLTPTTISDWEILLEQNRSRMMASIEDVTKLIGLPYLGGPTKEASSPASGSNTARSSKAKTTPRASPAKPRTHGQSFQPAGMSKGGMDASIRVASGSAAASLMAASGGAPQGLPQLYEDAGVEVDAILAPLGPWCGPQALGNTPAPRPWQISQGIQSQQQQQHQAVDRTIGGQAYGADPAGAPSGISYGNGFARGGTAPPSSSVNRDVAPDLSAEGPHSWSSAGGEATAQRGSVSFESPSDRARLAHLHKLRQEGQAVLEAQQALLYPDLQPLPSQQHPTHPYQKFYKPQTPTESSLGAHHQANTNRVAWEAAERASARLRQSSAGNAGGKGYRLPEQQERHGGEVHGEPLEGLTVAEGGGASRMQQQGEMGADERSNLSAEASFAEHLGVGHKTHGAGPAGGEGAGRVKEGELLTEASFEVLPNRQHAGGVQHASAGAPGLGAITGEEGGVGGDAHGVQVEVHVPITVRASSAAADVNATTLAFEGVLHTRQQHPSYQAAPQPDIGAALPAFLSLIWPASLLQTLPASSLRTLPASLLRTLPATLVRTLPAFLVQALPAFLVRTLPASLLRALPATLLQTMPAHSLHSNSGAQVGSSGVQADGESGDMGAAMERHRSVDGLMHRQEDVLGPGAPLDGSDLKEQREGLEGGSWDGISEQQQQQLGGRDASFGEAPSYPYYYSEEQRRQLEEEEAQLQEHRQPISEQQRQQLQQELVDAGMTIPRGSRVVGLQTRAVARNAGEASSGPSTRASSGKVAREAGAQSSNVPEDDNAQEGEQGQQEVVVVLEEGTMSGDGEGQPKEPGMYRTHTMVLPPKHPVLTSGIQYTVVKAVGVPLLRRAEAEEGERAARMAQLEAELGAPRLARQQREGQRAGKALRRMSGTQEAPPPPPQGVSMVRTVQGRRQPSPGPREELPPQPAPFVAPPPMPIPTLATKPKGPGTNPAPKVPHALPPIRSGSDREKARTSNSNATTFGHAITDIGKAKMQDVWMS